MKRLIRTTLALVLLAGCDGPIEADARCDEFARPPQLRLVIGYGEDAWFASADGPLEFLAGSELRVRADVDGGAYLDAEALIEGPFEVAGAVPNLLLRGPDEPATGVLRVRDGCGLETSLELRAVEATTSRLYFDRDPDDGLRDELAPNGFALLPGAEVVVRVERIDATGERYVLGEGTRDLVLEGGLEIAGLDGQLVTLRATREAGPAALRGPGGSVLEMRVSSQASRLELLDAGRWLESDETLEVPVWDVNAGFLAKLFDDEGRVLVGDAGDPLRVVADAPGVVEIELPGSDYPDLVLLQPIAPGATTLRISRAGVERTVPVVVTR